MAGQEKRIAKKDIIKDIIFFLITVSVSYGYILLLLLIISFVFVSILPMKFKHMLIISGIVTVIIAVGYIVKRVRKYRKF